MNKIISLDNIHIPSLNNKYIKSRTTGNLILSREYKEFKNLIVLSARKGLIKPPYVITVMVSTYLDYDNFLKPLTDGLEQAGVIDNDKNILTAHIYKTPIKKNKGCSLLVYVDTMESV